jgi:signal transduction histidine kinase
MFDTGKGRWVRRLMKDKRTSSRPQDELDRQKRAGLLSSAPEDLIHQALRLAPEDPSLESVVGHVLTFIFEALGSASTAVFMLDDARETAVLRWVCKEGATRSGKDDQAHPFGGEAVPLSRVLSWEDRFSDTASAFLISIASHPGVSEEIRSWARVEGYSSILAVPLRCGDTLVGSLSVRFRTDRRLDARELELAQRLADQAAIFLVLAHRALEKEAASVLDERNRMAGEMHDTIAQGLAGVILRIDMATPKLGPDAAEARGNLKIAAKLARDTLSHARKSVWNLGEAPRQERDLVRALKRLAQEGSPGSGARVVIQAEGPLPELPYRISDNLFQIAREGVANALRHAEARTIHITLSANPAELLLRITDDGRGFVTLPKSVRRGFGLGIMEKRAKGLGAEFSMASRPGEGVKIAVRLPLSTAIP